MDYKLELLLLPVSDVDRAKTFYTDQAGFNLDALERAASCTLTDRDALLDQQHQAARWTYLGSGMVHERFVGTLRRALAR